MKDRSSICTATLPSPLLLLLLHHVFNSSQPTVEIHALLLYCYTVCLTHPACRVTCSAQSRAVEKHALLLTGADLFARPPPPPLPRYCCYCYTVCSTHPACWVTCPAQSRATEKHALLLTGADLHEWRRIKGAPTSQHTSCVIVCEGRAIDHRAVVCYRIPITELVPR